MNLTVAQVADAVGRNEVYVRQHVHRGHLAVRREGRSVYVDLDEAARWARERGLPLVLPGRSFAGMTSAENRTARMTVLAWQSKNEQPINLFTHLRHRREDSLGPWAGQPSETWSTHILPTAEVNEDQALRLYSLNSTLERCQALVADILNQGILEIDGVEVHYSLVHSPRRTSGVSR